MLENFKFSKALHPAMLCHINIIFSLYYNKNYVKTLRKGTLNQKHVFGTYIFTCEITFLTPFW